MNEIHDNNGWVNNQNFQNGSESMNHSGKGPKGYVRSDEKIHDQVCEELFRNIWVDASDIEVEVKHGFVTLKGHVSERKQKKAAEACAESIPGVKDVMNYLTITDRGLIGDMNIKANMI